MSYILDALRKSERERSLGDTPRITFSRVEEDAPGRPAWVWVLIAVLGVAVGVLGAMQFSGWNGQQQAQQVQTDSPVTEPVPAPLPAPRVVVAEPDPEPEAVAEVIKPAPAPRKQPVKVSTPSGPVEVEMPVTTRDSRAETASSSPEPLPAPSLKVPTPSEVAEEYEASRDSDEPPVWEVDEPVAEEPVPEEEEDYIVTYYGLPAATRNSLGELAMNAHVYSSTPGRGFVIINGGKYREGDVLNEGAVVDEIRQDGVVLEYRNELFLLPVPR